MKPIIDFNIVLTDNPRVIIVEDNSKWEHIENKPAIIEILKPGSSKAVVHYFDKFKLNKFNSLNLDTACNSSCGCNSDSYHWLPDGVYEITVKGSPDIFSCTKKYLHTATTRLRIDKIYAKVSCRCKDKAIIEKIDKMEFMLNSAEANVRLDNICTAQEILEELENMIERFGDCECI